MMLGGFIIAICLAVITILAIIAPLHAEPSGGGGGDLIGAFLMVVFVGVLLGVLIVMFLPGLLSIGVTGGILMLRSGLPYYKSRSVGYSTSSGIRFKTYEPLWHTPWSQAWADVDDLAWRPPILNLVGGFLLGASIMARVAWVPLSINGDLVKVFYWGGSAVVTIVAIVLIVRGTQRRWTTLQHEHRELAAYRAAKDQPAG